MLCSVLTRSRIPVACSKRLHLAITSQMSSSAADNDHILIKEVSDKVLITLNRPKVLNAVTKPMATRCLQLLKDYEITKSMVIIKGAGNQSFSVGGDIRSIVAFTPAEAMEMFRDVYSTDYLLRNYKIPYVALIDGFTMGGGAGLAVHGEYCVATERTVMAMPEAGIGMIPDVGSSYFLSRLDRKLGLFLGMTGYRLHGDDTRKAGLATHFCESSRIGELEAALLKCTSRNEVPDIVNSFATKSSKEFGLNPYMDKINEYFGRSTVEEIFECLERDGSEWALSTIAALKRMSPLSLKLTHRQLTTGRNLSLAEGLKMEYRIVSRCMESHDYREGVRALIIDKDRKPKWDPSTVQGVTEEQVAKFFAKLPEEKELKLKT